MKHKWVGPWAIWTDCHSGDRHWMREAQDPDEWDCCRKTVLVSGPYLPPLTRVPRQLLHRRES